MGPNDEFYQGVRPADLRFENAHLLAEYIHCSQTLVNSAAATQLDSRKLLAGALVTSNEGYQRFQKAGIALKAVANDAQRDLGRTIDIRGGALITGLKTVMSEVRDAGANLIRQSGQAILAPVMELTRATAQLLQASTDAETSRAAASDARMKLIDYRRELDIYEATVLKRCKAAIAEATAGSPLLERLCAVFNPPTVTFSIPKPPPRPGVNRKGQN